MVSVKPTKTFLQNVMTEFHPFIGRLLQVPRDA
jgi:hypothetical protein